METKLHLVLVLSLPRALLYLIPSGAHGWHTWIFQVVLSTIASQRADPSGATEGARAIYAAQELLELISNFPWVESAFDSASQTLELDRVALSNEIEQLAKELLSDIQLLGLLVADLITPGASPAPARVGASLSEPSPAI